MKVLIIDDDEVDRMSIMRAMQQASTPVSLAQADTAEAGLILARQTAFDVVLLDYRLPDRDGIEVLKELQHLGTRHTTVVMLSHQDDLALAQQAIGAGAQDFLLKEEVNPRRLLRTVYQAQQRHGLEEKLRDSHDRLRLLAERDSLTGLANRYDFERSLRLSAARSQRGDHSMAILLLDIDCFKEVNDTYGHDIGDQMLVQVARRLETVVRDSDVLARLGGDEFVVLLQDATQSDQPILLAQRIIGAFAEPLVFNGKHHTITASVGVATFGDSAGDAISLLKCADIAMYRAKQEGRNRCHFYSDQLHREVRARAELEHSLRWALERNEFRVHYQAQIDARNGLVAGMEALVRWQHPERGLLSPGHFLAHAEELGMMPAIGQQVLRTACQQLQAWRARMPERSLKLSVAVNLSASQLHGEDLLLSIENALLASGLPGTCLELEITENALLKKPELIAKRLKEVVARGVSLALDDFGTGYSSFEHLRIFPVHRLKIDQSFVKTLGENAAQDRLLNAMIRFGKALGLVVIAEGVETAAQASACREAGCDLLQGYYFSKPVCAEEFEACFLSSVSSVSSLPLA
jgi:diguanylate cyclase (GGDEF)-like protein